MDTEGQAAARELIERLQDAHFAARRIEQYLPPDPHDRLVDRLHAARLLAQRLVTKLA